MKDLLDFIARTMVDRPDRVAVSQVKGDLVSIYELRVDSRDLGKVIGKNGQNISALRTILNAAAGRTKTKTILKIIE